MSRWRAALNHLLISLAVAGPVLIALAMVCYPPPWFGPADGPRLFGILIAVFLGSGPLLTLLVFRSGKWGMRFDLWTIGLLQLAGLAYGGWMIYQSRPVFVVFNVDRFSLIHAVDLRAEDLADLEPSLSAGPSNGPRLVGARLPEDEELRQAITVSAITQGRDLDRMPQHYAPYSDFSADVIAAGMSLDELVRRNPDRGAAIRSAAAEAGTSLLAVPMLVRKKAYAVLVDAESSRVVDVVVADPWLDPDSSPP